MEKQNSATQSVQCSVQQCQYHSGSNSCSLSSIQIGTHEMYPTKTECTDCESFALKAGMQNKK
ncbi:MAG: DUF1540 domain-containing protein [Eubacteriaceae bacterium]|nr:DUF1540 domain-containing protein [Eubacteriaceae bacterium]